jgi:hypothetical protein
MARHTPTYRLLNHLLPEGLDEFVATRRKTGRSWRLISRDVFEITAVDVSFETLRAWYLDDTNGDDEAAA